jgi:dihydroorotate dehydrogenase
MMYTLARPLLFTLCPEKAHGLALKALRSGLMPRQTLPEYPRLKQQLFNLSFAHPIGLAAGFDKNAEAIAGIASQGMAFVECGTVTPRPQSGNPRPRVFRLVEHEAIINRLGFNNEGLEVFEQNLRATKKHHAIVGGNIGKNKDSEDAIADYVTALNRLYDAVDYITVNISSPNTPGLRDMQAQEVLEALITTLHAARNTHAAQGKKTTPILIKIAPDLDSDALAMIAETALRHRLDGLIISNTTISRPEAISAHPHAHQAGGLSGKPLMPSSTQALASVAKITRGAIPLIGVGGVASAQDAYEKILHGASLVQLYTALVYQGFGMIPTLVSGLDALLARDGFSYIRDAVGARL